MRVLEPEIEMIPGRMPGRAVNLGFLLISIAVTAIIVHGSLYPYAFKIPFQPVGPFTVLIRTWSKPPTSLRDLLANIVLYIPFGFFAVMAMRSEARIWLVTFAGLSLCTTMELL